MNEDDKRLIENAAAELRPGDRVSLSGFGRLHFVEAGTETRKGRLHMKIQKYLRVMQ